MPNSQNQVLAVIGLGYVGLPLAVEFGKQRAVIGFDVNLERIDELRAGHDKTLEISADELIEAQYLRFSADPSAIADCNLYIVTVPTPIDAHKRPDLTPLLRARHRFVAENFYSADLALKGKMFCNDGWAHAEGSNLIGWTKRAGNSPLVYLQPGDDDVTYDNPIYRRLVENAIRWVVAEGGRGGANEARPAT